MPDRIKHTRLRLEIDHVSGNHLAKVGIHFTVKLWITLVRNVGKREYIHNFTLKSVEKRNICCLSTVN